MMQIVTMNREQAEAYKPIGSYEVCISIRDPGDTRRNLSPNFRSVLELEMHDLETEHAGIPSDGHGRVRPLRDEDAYRAVEFVATHAAASRLVVHCDAGISRSVSMAEALADVFDARWLNWTVYRKVVEAHKTFRRYQHGEKEPIGARFKISGPTSWKDGHS